MEEHSRLDVMLRRYTFVEFIESESKSWRVQIWGVNAAAPKIGAEMTTNVTGDTVPMNILAELTPHSSYK